MTAPLPPPGFVVDTSVAVKWYVERQETDLAYALRLLEAFNQGRCVLRAPELLYFELANALATGHKLRSRIVWEALDDLRELSMQVEPFHWSTLQKAVEIASACGTTIYDSYFLALALETNSILVTADEAFLRSTRPYPNVVSLRGLRMPD